MAKKKPSRKPNTAPAGQAEAPAPLPFRRVHFARSLRVQLSDEEIAQRADRAAHKLADVVARKEELKASTKHQKSIIETIEAEVHELSGEVRTRSTYRMIDCEQIFDYDAVRVREVRLDTGEVLDERRMSEAERQRELFTDNGEALHEAADAAGQAGASAGVDEAGAEEDDSF